MKSIARYGRFVALAVLVMQCEGPLPSLAQVGLPTVASLTLSPSTIAGGSGASSTATVTLGAAAPTGGTVVTLASSNTGLAASGPSVTVAQGATSATFTVATNALYRRYSGLSFTVTISASANGSTASATLTVTAQPPPPDITGDSCQREGFVCGGSFPAGRGEAGILYECFVAPTCNGMNGTCTFRQECPLGCQSAPADGFSFNDACATTGPFPIALSPSYIISGDRPTGSLFLDAPAPSGSGGAAQSNNFTATTQTSGGVTIPAGATSASFAIATSYVPSIQFVGISGAIVRPQPLPGGGIAFTNRLGLGWLTMAPPDPPPGQVVPTLAALSVQGGNPVTGGTRSWEIVSMSGVSPAGGPTIALSSSNPAVASVPPNVTIAAGGTGALVFISTQPVAQTTTVTLTATDGRYTFSDTLTVQATNQPPPAVTVSSLALNPSSVTGGTSSAGSVTLSGPAPAGGATVTLSSSNPPVANVPPSGNVTVPAGTTSATFTVSTSSVAATSSATISASFGGASVTAPLTVTPPPPPPPAVTLSTLALSPTSVVGPASSTGTITLSAAAPPGGAVVTLSSSDPTVAKVPVSGNVTVPAGNTNATFTLTTVSVTASTTVTISASFGGVTKTALLTVTPPPPPAADTVAITVAEYAVGDQVLVVEATSTSSSATLKVFVTSTGALIGTLTNNGGGSYTGQFSLPVNPQNITAKSSLGGSVTKAVVAN